MKSPAYDYVLFIDEAGDDSLTKVYPIDENGSSEWLVLAGVLVRAEDEAKCRSWLDEIREDINALQSPVVHFRKLSPRKKARAAELLAKLEVRAFVVLSNKKNVRGYNNARAAKAGGKQWFYNWIVRVLMERVTNFCLDNSQRKLGRAGKIKVIFSSRGGHSYGQTKAYWQLLKAQGKPYLNKYQMKFETLDYQLVDYVPHYMEAGLQIADVVASAFYQAVNMQSNNLSSEAAKLLSPIVAKDGGGARDCGIVLQPPRHNDIGLAPDQRAIFEEFGFKFKE